MSHPYVPEGYVATGQQGLYLIFRFANDAPDAGRLNVFVPLPAPGKPPLLVDDAIAGYIAEHGPITSLKVEQVPVIFRPMTPEEIAEAKKW